jgi:hypothetical protein
VCEIKLKREEKMGIAQRSELS